MYTIKRTAFFDYSELKASNNNKFDFVKFQNY